MKRLPFCHPTRHDNHTIDIHPALPAASLASKSMGWGVTGRQPAPCLNKRPSQCLRKYRKPTDRQWVLY